jgi:hypothetical protein
MSYYKIINGIRYDRSLLEAAGQYTEGRGEWRISLDEIQSIYTLALDGGKITETEWRTLRYIAQNFTLTNPAQEWFAQQAEDTGGMLNVDAIMQRIVREEFGLNGLNWQISSDEANRQNGKASSIVDFAAAIRSSLRAFLERGFNQLSLEAVARRRISGEETPEQNQQNIRMFLNDGGILYLVPETNRDSLELDLPHDLDTESNWYVALHIPTFAPVVFLARVARNNPSNFFNIGFISRRPPLEDIVRSVVVSLAQMPGLDRAIDEAEVNRQLEITEHQNFGEALFAALFVGIFNGESSFSFRDFIRDDIWLDPDRTLEFYMREYIRRGTIHLLSPEIAMDFNIPASFIPDFDMNWAFLLEMPSKTDVRFVITALRDGNLDFSWNDGFRQEGLSFQAQIEQVLITEFNLPALQLIANEDEFEAQREELGSDFRNFSSVLRQALNTILHDYIRPNSVFNVVGQKDIDDIDPDFFDDPFEYRAAIKHRIKTYLSSGTASLELLPRELPDNNPVDGEPIEDSWQFFGHIPNLAPVGFWVIIPRYPEPRQLPYTYGFGL